MTRRITCPTWIVLLLVYSFYWIWAPWPSNSFVFEVVNGLVMVFFAGVAWRTWPAARISLGMPVKDLHGGHFQVLGLFTVGVAALLSGAWRWVYRLADEPVWMMTNLVLASFTWIAVMSGMLLMLSSDAPEVASVPRPNWRRIATILALAAAIVVVLRLLVEER